MGILREIKSFIAYAADPQLRYEYKLTRKRELQHRQAMLDLELREKEAEVSAVRHREMYDSGDRLQAHLVQFRKDFHQEMLDWETLRETRQQRREGR